MEVKNLIGAQLDSWVARAQGMTVFAGTWTTVQGDTVCDIEDYWPSRNWAQGGPIIERERIDVISAPAWMSRQHYAAFINESAAERNDPEGEGPTPLVAAMRCYVASKFGDSVSDD